MPLPKPLSPGERWAFRQMDVHEIHASNAHEFVYVLHDIRDDLMLGVDNDGDPIWTSHPRRALRFTIDDIRHDVRWRRDGESRFYAVGRLIPLEDDDG